MTQDLLNISMDTKIFTLNFWLIWYVSIYMFYQTSSTHSLTNGSSVWHDHAFNNSGVTQDLLKISMDTNIFTIIFWLIWYVSIYMFITPQVHIHRLMDHQYGMTRLLIIAEWHEILQKRPKMDLTGTEKNSFKYF